ncbi:hypothetical protein AVEN_210801-1 [Araneus ventricosus]|uniref:Uncharacterized protein n=1 Tax=Araneus ventricosus TaxID=182803 RepID=A0A4Y2CL01_ARAVE|nr:hypothetical protein AVEN_210801-1 [Araneus ventricosus]
MGHRGNPHLWKPTLLCSANLIFQQRNAQFLFSGVSRSTYSAYQSDKLIYARNSPKKKERREIFAPVTDFPCVSGRCRQAAAEYEVTSSPANIRITDFRVTVRAYKEMNFLRVPLFLNAIMEA